MAVAAVVWRIALNAAKNLHEQDFVYDDDGQRLAVISEYVFFLVHLVDRETCARLALEQRRLFVSRLVGECARHLRQNAAEILSAGSAGSAGSVGSAGNGEPGMGAGFVSDFNSRSAEYAHTQYGQYDDKTPGYDMYRTFGAAVLAIMGESQTNKWVIDQIMDIDGPEANQTLQKALRTLLRECGEFKSV